MGMSHLKGTLFTDTPTCLNMWASKKQTITRILVKMVKAYSICYVSSMSCIKI